MNLTDSSLEKIIANIKSNIGPPMRALDLSLLVEDTISNEKERFGKEMHTTYRPPTVQQLMNQTCEINIGKLIYLL